MMAADASRLERGTDAHRPRAAELRVAVIRLASGRTAGHDWTREAWSELLVHATRERCAPLGWLRSASVIRQFAPSSVSGQWRAQALAAGELAAMQADAIGELVRDLSAAGVSPVVLKGVPLSVLLYREPGARPSFDIDLFVATHERELADGCLRRAKWRHLQGDAPAEGTYCLTASHRAASLEVHSSLFDDPLLAHVDWPAPTASPVDVCGKILPAHTGDSLPIFLAVHLSKHASVPLLWWIDFATCWGQLDRHERDRVRLEAASAGLKNFLAWAEGGVAQLETICAAPVSEAVMALARLDALHRSRNAFRVARLVGGLRNRIRVVAGWVAPPQYRSSPRAFAEMALRRIKARLARTKARHRTVADAPAEADAGRALVTDPATLADVVRDLTSNGRSAWIKARGTSMLPTIPRSADVLIAPVPPDGLARGDVVLVSRPGAGLLMHRVVEARGEILSLKGDNRFEPDVPVASTQVIGRAVALRVDGELRTVSRKPIRSLRFTLARCRTYLRRYTVVA